MAEKLKKLLFFLGFIGGMEYAASQNVYGNEWIDPSKFHVRIKVWEDKVYRVGFFSVDQLYTDAGLFLSGIPFDQFAVYNMGEQVPIYVFDQNSNNRFDPLDYIEFVGHPADGRIDEALYDKPGDQRHQIRNMVSDTNVYFLTTRTGITNKRYVAFGGSATQKKEYHISKYVFAPDINYHEGLYYPIGDKLSYPSDYVYAEGFYGDQFSSGSDENEIRYSVELKVPDNYAGGFKPELESCVFATRLASNPGVPNNWMRILISPDMNARRLLVDTQLVGPKMIREKFTLDYADLGTDKAYLLFNPRRLPGVNWNFWGHSHTILRYARKYNFADSAFYKFEEDTSSGPRLIEWNNYAGGRFTKPLVYDETNGYRYVGSYDPSTRNVTYSVPGLSRRGNCIATDAERIEVLGIFRCQPVNTINYSAHINNAEYLMITHPGLMSPRGEIQDYKQFWEKKYIVQLNMVTDLYDYFSFGLPHPLAIRNYCKFLIEKSDVSQRPRFMLLLGRGFDNMYNRGVFRNSIKAYEKFNRVPTIGHPISDWMFTSGLGGMSDMEPAIPTGRVSADSADDIRDYLDKLKDYVSPDNQYQSWQKNILHLGGGATVDQTMIIKSRLDALKTFPESDPFAGLVHSFSKAAVGTVDPNFTDQIKSRINTGTNLVTFLGHGSTSVTDIDIGKPESYENSGRYPIFYFNGCQVGNPGVPGSQFSLGERVMKSRRKAGIAFIGQTALSELYTVSSQMRAFYMNYFDSTPDKTIGSVLKKTINIWQNLSSPLNENHCRQLFLQGDPAVPVASPLLPDFSVRDEDVFLNPENAYALMDSFNVAFVVTNNGKGVKDSFNVDLHWVYPDGVTKRNFSKRVKIRGFRDTVFMRVNSKDVLVRGDNQFIITLNRDQNPAEFTYSNNIAYYKRYIPGNGANLVSPPDFSIIGTDSVELVAQGADLFKQSEDYFFELDTTPWFNSPLLISLEKQGKPMNRPVLARWKVKLPVLRDTQVYFWRARISTSVKEGGGWQMASFTYIKDHPNGWMQNIHWQYVQPASGNALDFVYSDSATRHIRFSKVLKKIYIDCQYFNASNKGVKESGFGSQDLNFGVCKNGIVAMPWNGRKLVREPLDPAVIQPDCFWGRAWKTFGNADNYQLYYAFQMSSPTEQDEFIKFINALPDSNYVTIYCRNQSFADQWKPEVMQALNRIGSAIFDTASKRTADAMWVCLGKKGWKPGQAQENHTFGQVSPYVSLEGEMIGDANTGSMTSELIGPTNKYHELWLRPVLKKDGLEEEDFFEITVRGIDTAGKNSVILKGRSERQHNLQVVNTSRFKYIYLRADFTDYLGHTSPNLVNWRVTMDPSPEGSIFPDPLIGYKFYRDTLYEGDTFRLSLPFRNIGKLPFRDSILVEYSIFNKINRNILKRGKLKIPALRPDSFWVFSEKLPTTGLSGLHALQIAFNPRFAQPEQSLSNNTAILNFYIQKDIINPLLDVTFDGKHIVNGEIVSANPFILISSKDENKWLLQKDTQKVRVLIKKPGSTDFTEPAQGEAVFYPARDAANKARVEYRPKDLPDGIYVMKVQSWDFSNNRAGSNEYEISFNVVREQTVTRFYPYPNPFTSSMRFVFTLTGTRVPEDIRIKIMNAEGKVVKEVSKEELGNIRVGNNITDWTWDGTDQFGDKLANGTYFYKVTVKDGGEELKIRETKGDGSFKEQVGVIYLMR